MPSFSTDTGTPLSSATLACSWSGGKDSCFALMRRLREGGELKVLLNMMNESGRRSRSHGLPAFMLEQQAASLGVPILYRASSWADYQANFIEMLAEANTRFGAGEVVFGDIDLQAHRDWEEMVCSQAGVRAALPLWQEDRRSLVLEMLAAGIETHIVSCNSLMGAGFIGRRLDESLITKLIGLGIDPCGEEGEFHTVVTNCPLFAQPVLLPELGAVEHQGYWFANFQGSTSD